MWIFLRLMKTSFMDVVRTRKNNAETAPKTRKKVVKAVANAVVVDYPFKPWKRNLHKRCAVAKEQRNENAAYRRKYEWVNQQVKVEASGNLRYRK